MAVRKREPRPAARPATSSVRPAPPAARHATPAARPAPPAPAAPPWTFLTNHAHVLFCIAGDPQVRVRDVAAAVGITERAVQKILSELEEEGYLVREKDGRRNRYEIRAALPLRHPIERHCAVSSLLAILAETKSPKRR